MNGCPLRTWGWFFTSKDDTFMKSEYQDRDTVGTIYLDAQKNSAEGLTIGDINDEMVHGLVDDLNKSIQSNPFGNNKPFWINVVEERDLQMPNSFKRRLYNFEKRPYPEDNTLVFYIEPESNKVCYCWDLPHHSEMWNILSNTHLYPEEYIQRIKEWQNYDLTNFGFKKVTLYMPFTNAKTWIPNPNHKDVPYDHGKTKISLSSTG